MTCTTRLYAPSHSSWSHFRRVGRGCSLVQEKKQTAFGEVDELLCLSSAASTWRPDRRRHGKVGEQGGVGEGRGTGIALSAPARFSLLGTVRRVSSGRVPEQK